MLGQISLETDTKTLCCLVKSYATVGVAGGTESS